MVDFAIPAAVAASDRLSMVLSPRLVLCFCRMAMRSVRVVSEVQASCLREAGVQIFRRSALPVLPLSSTWRLLLVVAFRANATFSAQVKGLLPGGGSADPFGAMRWVPYAPGEAHSENPHSLARPLMALSGTQRVQPARPLSATKLTQRRLLTRRNTIGCAFPTSSPSALAIPLGGDVWLRMVYRNQVHSTHILRMLAHGCSCGAVIVRKAQKGFETFC